MSEENYRAARKDPRRAPKRDSRYRSRSRSSSRTRRDYKGPEGPEKKTQEIQEENPGTEKAQKMTLEQGADALHLPRCRSNSPRTLDPEEETKKSVRDPKGGTIVTTAESTQEKDLKALRLAAALPALQEALDDQEEGDPAPNILLRRNSRLHQLSPQNPFLGSLQSQNKSKN